MQKQKRRKKQGLVYRAINRMGKVHSKAIFSFRKHFLISNQGTACNFILKPAETSNKSKQNLRVTESFSRIFLRNRSRQQGNCSL